MVFSGWHVIRRRRDGRGEKAPCSGYRLMARGFERSFSQILRSDERVSAANRLGGGFAPGVESWWERDADQSLFRGGDWAF